MINTYNEVLDMINTPPDSGLSQAPIDLTDVIKEIRFYASDLIKFKTFIKEDLTVPEERKLSRMIHKLQAGASELNLLEYDDRFLNETLVKIVKPVAIILDILDEVDPEDYYSQQMELIETGENLICYLNELFA